MISVIMCSRSEADADAAVKVYNAALSGVPYHIVKVIGAPSMSIGYNAALSQAKGEIIIFTHDDIDILGADGFANRLMAHLEHVDLLGVAGTTHLVGPNWNSGGLLHVYGQAAHLNQQAGGMTVNVFRVPARRIDGIQAIDGMFMAARRAVVDRVRFDESIPHFHFYDLDFSYCAFLAGFRIGVACDLHLLHRSHGAYQSPEWGAAKRLFMNKHRARFPKLAHDINVGSREEALAQLRRHAEQAPAESLTPPPFAPPPV